MRILTLISVLFICLLGSTQNPIVPAGMYIADPEAHVWQDGRLYIYGSRDESDDHWCSWSHHILSTNDMKHWSVDENAFASKGEYDQIDYHDALLFAPDCAYKDGTYYLYYCSPGKQFTEGVATSSSPLGPFKNGVQIEGTYQIDPAVLIDEDGQGYYYWGQGKPKVAKLTPNLKSIDKSTLVEPLDAEGNKAFHEGSSIRRIGDKYYLIFADESRDNRPTCLGYAISNSPMGPFTYKGIIIDNRECDPASWNNHGSIEKFKDQWYVFYHRNTHNSRKFRKACIEPIHINKDGTIDEVEMTSQGAGEAISASRRLEAEWACGLSGNLRITSLLSSDLPIEGLSEIQHGDQAIYKYINFERGKDKFEIKVSNSLGGKIELRIDSPDGELIGECTIDDSQSKEAYFISSCDIEKTKGKHALYLSFIGSSETLFCIDWFSFK